MGKMSDLFFEIWNERERISFISGEPLRNPPMAHYFFHLLPKNPYQKYKFEKKNIILTTDQEHIDWHIKTKEELLKQDANWQSVFDLYEELKIEYNKLPIK